MMYSWTVGFPEETKISDAYQMLKKQGNQKKIYTLYLHHYLIIVISHSLIIKQHNTVLCRRLKLLFQEITSASGIEMNIYIFKGPRHLELQYTDGTALLVVRVGEFCFVEIFLITFLYDESIKCSWNFSLVYHPTVKELHFLWSWSHFSSIAKSDNSLLLYCWAGLLLQKKNKALYFWFRSLFAGFIWGNRESFPAMSDSMSHWNPISKGLLFEDLMKCSFISALQLCVTVQP